VDAKIPPQESDAALIGYLRSIQRSILVVGTKADKLSGNEKTKSANALKEGLGIEQLLLCSAKTGLGIKEIWTEMRALQM
jgi:GTP-binding protein